MFEVGERVITHGLSSKEFNRKVGYVSEPSPSHSGRVVVRFDEISLGSKAIRPQCLKKLPSSEEQKCADSREPFTEVLLGCSVCSSKVSKDGDKLKVCAGCNSLRYCSREHQALDWKSHKKLCEQLRHSKDVSVKLSKKLNSARSKIRRGKLDEAKIEAQSAFTLAKSVPNQERFQVLALKELSCCQGVTQSVQTLKKALKIAEVCGDSESLSIVHSRLALQLLSVDKRQAFLHMQKSKLGDLREDADVNFFFRTEVGLKLLEDPNQGLAAATAFLTKTNDPEFAQFRPLALMLKCWGCHDVGVKLCTSSPVELSASSAAQGLKAKSLFLQAIDLGNQGIGLIDSSPEFMDAYLLKDLLVHTAHAYVQVRDFDGFKKCHSRFKLLIQKKLVAPAKEDVQVMSTLEKMQGFASMFR